MNNEVIIAVAKAVEEASKLGVSLTTLFKVPLQELAGMIGDRVKYARLEQIMHMLQKAQTLAQELGLEDRLLPVAPKLIVPILENASLEDDEFLQDMWVRLLISAANPDIKAKVRTAFVDLIKQLEAIDAKVLHRIYEIACHKAEHWNTLPGHGSLVDSDRREADDETVDIDDILEGLTLDRYTLCISLDNLTCVSRTIEQSCSG